MKFLVLSLIGLCFISVNALASDFRLECNNSDGVSVLVESEEEGKFAYTIETGKITLSGTAVGVATKDPSPSLGFLYFEELKGGFSWWLTKTEESNSVLCLPGILDASVQLECAKI